MADEEQTTEETGAPDLGAFVPDTFKGEDGAFDTKGFREKFDELSAFKAQADERSAGLPESAEGYAWSLPEEHALPEGFDPKALNTVDADGNEVVFDPAKMISADDPDVKALQGILHEIGAPADVTAKLAGLMVNRELRGVMEAQAQANEQMKALGPDAQSRIDVVSRELTARLPKDQAAAVLDGIGSADALRGLEAMLKSSGVPPSAAPGGMPDTTNMTATQKIRLGLEMQRKGAKSA